MESTANFTEALYQSYFDLSDALPHAPFHVKGIEFGIKSLLENVSYPRMQASLNPSFRTLLCKAASRREHVIDKPQDLALELRSRRWQALCDIIDHFDDIDMDAQVRLGWLVGKLCFQKLISQLLPVENPEHLAQTEGAASRAYLRALARCRLWLDGDPEFQDYSLVEFQRIAEHSRPGIGSIDAHYQLVVQNVKHSNDVEAVAFWQNQHLAAIERARPELDSLTFAIVMSRFHRVGGFIPQMRRDQRGVVSEMDLAEEYARGTPRRTEAEAAAADEILYPVLESRTKEALWIDNLELADQRSNELLDLSPADPRAWLHRGQVLFERGDIPEALSAYRKAVRYAPPGGEIAWFRVGQCLEALGELEEAIDAYLSSLAIDPLGISAVQRLAQLVRPTGNMPLAVWCGNRLNDLNDLAKRRQGEKKEEPYKHLPPPRRAVS